VYPSKNLRKPASMITAQAALIIAGVAFVAVAITGSRQFVKVVIPELKLWSRGALGIIGAGLFACAFLVPTVTGQSSDQVPTASNPTVAPLGAGPTNSPVAAVSKSAGSTNETPTPGTPTVIIDTPKNNAEVPERGFPVKGTVSSLGTGALWLFDADGGTNYTIDEPVTVTALSGKWLASEGNVGGS
jgi:hypothetical protein